MIQRVNGVNDVVKVLSWPDYMEVKRATKNGLPVGLIVARYDNNGRESTTIFTLSDIKNLHDTALGFCYSGVIANADIGPGVERESRPTLFVTSGRARVDVDNLGAKLHYSIHISVHEL